MRVYGATSGNSTTNNNNIYIKKFNKTKQNRNVKQNRRKTFTWWRKFQQNASHSTGISVRICIIYKYTL